MSEQPQGTRLTPVGKILSFLLILALVAIGAYVVWTRANPGGGGRPNGGAGPTPPLVSIESPDPKGLGLQAKEYTYIPGIKLPPVKGTSNYKWDANKKILRFSYNVWAGWLPVIAANHGTKANDESIFYKKYGFRVEMVLMDNPLDARTAFASGDVHTLWGTADMMVLFAAGLSLDSRTAPRIVQQIDWSNGGDGIVVRSNIRTVRDLKGKTITLAKNSPSEYYLTNLLLSAGLKPADIKANYTETAFQAATAFVSDKKVDGCVSWSPDIYTIADKVQGTKILSSTSEANKLIADVYAVRADFAKDHADVVEGLVAGIFEGMEMVKKDPTEPCKWMAEAFGMKPEDVAAMRNDAHLTNFAENVQFFMNANNPTNFERTWKNACYVYRELGTMEPKDIVPFDQVMDFTVLQNLQKAGRFKDHQDENIPSFTPAGVRKISAERPVLTQTIRINFYPNSANPYEPARDQDGMPVAGKLYDPNVDPTLERVARLVGQFAKAVVLIEGHTDSSMKGRVPVNAVQELSKQRAEAIKRALVEKYKFDPNKFTVEGKGWDIPANPEDAMNQALNRRVEISVYPPEQAN